MDASAYKYYYDAVGGWAVCVVVLAILATEGGRVSLCRRHVPRWLRAC